MEPRETNIIITQILERAAQQVFGNQNLSESVVRTIATYSHLSNELKPKRSCRRRNEGEYPFGAKQILDRLDTAINSRACRVILAILGGYGFTSGYFAMLSIALVATGFNRPEAMWWGVLTSFLIYTIVVIWIAATKRPWLTSLLIIGGAAAMVTVSPSLALHLEPTPA